MKIIAGARSSPLSRAQFEEAATEIHSLHPQITLEPIWVETIGDLDQKTSLRNLDKIDFFTRELDQMLLRGEVRIAIHSAKDLPEPLCKGLSLVALTRGVDPRDSLVFREGETLETLPKGAIIATSSIRREETVKRLRGDLQFIDLRGNINERLKKLQNREADGIVVAEAALIRLKLTHLNRIFLPGDTAPRQGQLAILARSGDEEMKHLFSSWRRALYVGLDPSRWPHRENLIHYPVIRTEKIDSTELQEALRLWPQFTHVIFTSRSAVNHWFEKRAGSFDKIFIAIGEGTAEELRKQNLKPLLSPEPTQEGIMALLNSMDLHNAYLFLPHSKRARADLTLYLQERQHRYFVLDLYETIFQRIDPLVPLDIVDEIVFTSPSTIEGFLKIYGDLPKNKQLTTLGPITQKALEFLLRSRSRNQRPQMRKSCTQKRFSEG